MCGQFSKPVLALQETESSLFSIPVHHKIVERQLQVVWVYMLTSRDWGLFFVKREQQIAVQGQR